MAYKLTPRDTAALCPGQFGKAADIATPPILIGVAGGTGSGKTTLTQALLERIGADLITYIQHDSYYLDWDDLPASEDDHPNFDHPDALETSLMIAHLRALRAGHSVQQPVYDFRTHARTGQSVTLLPHPIILVEGILIFAEAALRDLFDLRIFVDTDDDVRFIRRLLRDTQERARSQEWVIRQWLGTVKPMHMQFVEPSRRYAHVIIPEGAYNEPAMQMLEARIQAIRDQRG